jgi:uncharacterized protein YaaQ
MELSLRRCVRKPYAALDRTMKLILAIVNNDDSRNVVDRLNRRGFSVTVNNTSGGFLRVGNTTLLCGVDDGRVDEVLGIIRESCPTRVQYVTGDGTG